MRKPSTYFTDKLREIYDALKLIDQGGTGPSVTMYGRDWSGSTSLHALLEVVRIEASYAVVLEGGQSYQVENHGLIRAPIAELDRMRQAAKVKLNNTVRGGMRVRLGVPIV